MLKIQMLEQIVTSDSVAEQQKQEEHEQQQQQKQDEQNGYDISVVCLFWKILREVSERSCFVGVPSRLRGTVIALQTNGAL